jgi:hypothetical protein
MFVVHSFHLLFRAIGMFCALSFLQEELKPKYIHAGVSRWLHQLDQLIRDAPPITRVRCNNRVRWQVAARTTENVC